MEFSHHGQILCRCEEQIRSCTCSLLPSCKLNIKQESHFHTPLLLSIIIETVVWISTRLKSKPTFFFSSKVSKNSASRKQTFSSAASGIWDWKKDLFIWLWRTTQTCNEQHVRSLADLHETARVGRAPLRYEGLACGTAACKTGAEMTAQDRSFPRVKMDRRGSVCTLWWLPGEGRTLLHFNGFGFTGVWHKNGADGFGRRATI